jgi:hypothetical protein
MQQLFWAVRCRADHIIPLAYIHFEPDGTATFGFWSSPLRVNCTLCKQEADYRGDQVLLYSGPPPVGEFQIHPAFQSDDIVDY